jgi:ATP-binding cassette subfamily C protein LapB
MTFLMAGPLGWVLVVAVPLMMLVAMLIQGGAAPAMSATCSSRPTCTACWSRRWKAWRTSRRPARRAASCASTSRPPRRRPDSALRSRAITSLDHQRCRWSRSRLVTLVMLVWGVYLIDDKGELTGGALIGGGDVRDAGGGAAVQRGACWPRATRAPARPCGAGPSDGAAGGARRRARYVPRRDLSGRMGLHDVGFAYPATGGRPGRACSRS